MGSKELQEYLSEVYCKNVPGKTMLLKDSWPEYKNKDLIKNVTRPGKTIHALVLPSKATSLLQPFDKYGFRILNKTS